MAIFLWKRRVSCFDRAYCSWRGRRGEKLVIVEKFHVMKNLFWCRLGIDKKSFFERPNISAGRYVWSVLGTWSGR